MSTNNNKSRPIIIRLLSKTTHAHARCPHCSASGRHIQWFITDSGEIAGAMSGCIQNAFWTSSHASELAKWEKLLVKYPGWRRATDQIDRIAKQIAETHEVDVMATPFNTTIGGSIPHKVGQK